MLLHRRLTTKYFAFRFIAVTSCLFLLSAHVYSGSADTRDTQELRYGEVLFNFYQQDYFTALTQLLRSRQVGYIANQEPDSHQLLIKMYTLYGLLQDAERMMNRGLPQNGEESLNNEILYLLGKVAYQRDYLDLSEDYLQRIKESKDKHISGDHKLLLSQVFIAKDRYLDAVGLLESWHGPEEWKLYAEYNLGVALIKGGKRREGFDVINRVGKTKSNTEEGEALRDRANLTLGYTLLREGQSDKARTYLERVGLYSDYSNTALLWSGWVYADQNNYQKALVPWEELLSRENLDRSVQSSQLAVPYAYSQLGAHGKASVLYKRAIGNYTKQIEELNKLIDAVNSGRTISQLLRHNDGTELGWSWQIKTIPNLPEMDYLTAIIADHRFQETLKNLNDLSFIHKRLLFWKESIDAFKELLELRRERYDMRSEWAKKILSRLNLDELRNAWHNLIARLNSIEHRKDVLALATREEWKSWTRLEGMHKSLDEIQHYSSTDLLSERRRFVRGVIYWRLNETFPIRLAENRRNLHEIDTVLNTSSKLRNSLLNSIRTASTHFQNLSSRITNSRERINELEPKLIKLVNAQKNFLNNVMLAELNSRLKQLRLDLVQAKFLIAQSYDQIPSKPK